MCLSFQYRQFDHVDISASHPRRQRLRKEKKKKGRVNIEKKEKKIYIVDHVYLFTVDLALDTALAS